MAVTVKDHTVTTEEVNTFIERVGLDRDIPAKAVEAPEQYRDALKKASMSSKRFFVILEMNGLLRSTKVSRKF